MYIVDFNTPVIKFDKINYDSSVISKLINMSEEEIKHKPNWYLIDGKWYYFKSIDKLERFINEILGSFLAKKNDLPTVDFKVAQCKSGRCSVYGLLSENFRLENKSYTTTFGLNLPIFDKGIENIKLVREYFKKEEDYYRFIVMLLKTVAIDFYMDQLDRVDENLIFSKEDDKVELSPLFDFSLSMDIGRKSVFQNFHPNTGLYTYHYIRKPKIKEKDYRNAFIELTFPSKETSQLFSDYPEFYETFKNLTEFDMEEFFKYLEHNYPLAIPRALKTHYLGYHKEKVEFMKKLI